MLSLRWLAAFFTGLAVCSTVQCRLLNRPFERIARTFTVDGALVVRKWEEQFIPEILDSLKQPDESDRKGHNGQFQFELDQADALFQDDSGWSSGSGSGSGDGSGFGTDQADLIPDTADPEKQLFDFMVRQNSTDDFIFIEDETNDL